MRNKHFEIGDFALGNNPLLYPVTYKKIVVVVDMRDDCAFYKAIILSKYNEVYYHPVFTYWYKRSELIKITKSELLKILYT
jgi:hypothetical protein